MTLFFTPLAKVVATLTFVSGMAYALPALSGSNNMPFNVNVSTLELLEPNATVRCPLAGMAIGTGTASYMGRILAVATDCVTPTPTGFQFSNGRLVFTAANGDTLTASYFGTFMGAPTGSVLTMSNGSYAITGGTGEFAGAFGRGELQGTEDTSTIPAHGHLEAHGTISLPGRPWAREPR